MAYQEELAAQVRDILRHAADGAATEKKMFGGLSFLIGGNMACGVHGDSLIIRLAPDTTQAALAEPGARPFDMTGRPMTGWILVDRPGYAEPGDLEKWISRGVAYAHSLPPK